MNLQERLLQNEIKHLGQIIQTLSYELIVLQDFLKDEHGSRFENFRATYSSSSGKLSSSTRGTQRSKKQTATSKELGNSPVLAATSTQPNANQLESELVGCMDPIDIEIHVENDNESLSKMDTSELIDSDTEYNAALSDSDNLKDPLDAETNEERRGGRRKTKIWKYFDKVTHRSNKFSARCHICLGLVSSRASRMVEHRLKCKRNLHGKGVQKTEKKNHAKEIRNEMKSMGLDDLAMGEFSDEESYLCSDNDQSGNDEKQSKKSGRALDTIWNYYKIVFPNGLKKAKCLSCELFVSPKAVRMRQHKIGCKGILKEEEKLPATTASSDFTLEETGVQDS